MKSISNSDDRIATAHIVLCVIFLTAGYVLYIYLRCFNLNNKELLMIQIPIIQFWDIIFGDLIITIRIQDLIHKLFDAYDNIFKAHWAIFSIKLILLII